MAARSQAWVCGRSLAGVAGSNCAKANGCSSVAYVGCCVGSGFCDGLISRPEECGVSDCDR